MGAASVPERGFPVKAKLLTLAFVLSAASIVATADQPSASGRWQVHFAIAGIEADRSCTLTQKDAELTGTCSTAQGTLANVSGKVEGSRIAFSYKSEYNGTPITLQYDGKLEAGKMSGTLAVPELSAQGEFTAQAK